MKKRYIFSAVGLVGAGAMVTYFARNMMNNNEQASTIKNAGIPDEVNNKALSQFENAKMVSEGSQYGVQYYNELRENQLEQ